MPTLRTNIEIAASPAEVRKTFLDFDSFPTWAKAHITGVQVVSGDKNNLEAGDKLRISFSSTTFNGTVLVNTPAEFKWRGSIPFIFTGEHSFQFLPSKTTPGHTTFVQEEDFTGLLSFLIGPTWSMGKQTVANFAALDGELKKRVEGDRT